MKFKPYQLVCVKDALPNVTRGIKNHFYVGETISMPTPDATIMIRRVPHFAGTLVELPLSALQPCEWSRAYVHLAQVEGSGSFPIDMLRSDECVPVNFTIDADNHARIIEGLGNSLVIARCMETSIRKPFDSLRWTSFGWRLTHIDCEKVK